MSTICAVILNYRNTQKTMDCIAALDIGVLNHIHVVDNSESVTEAMLLRSAISSFSQKDNYPQTSLTINETNLGYARSVNQVIKKDRTAGRLIDYYFLMNNDAIGTVDLISKLQAAIELDENIGAVAPNISEHGELHCRKWYDVLFGTTSMLETRFSFPYVTGCCLLVNTSILKNDQLFDEDFFMYGEDVWLCWQIKKKGKVIRCLDDVTVWHEGAGSSRKGSLFYEYHMARAQILIATKSSKNLSDMIIKHILRFIYLSARSVVRSIRYRNISPIVSVLLAWINIEIRP